jgi:hypothetical protein
MPAWTRHCLRPIQREYCENGAEAVAISGKSTEEDANADFSPSTYSDRGGWEQAQVD